MEKPAARGVGAAGSPVASRETSRTPRFASPSASQRRTRLPSGQWAARPIFASRGPLVRGGERSESESCGVFSASSLSRSYNLPRPVRTPRRIGQRSQRLGAGKELESVSRVAGELAHTADVEGVARTLLDEIASLFGVPFAGLTFVSDDGSEAVGYLARSHGADVDWWRELRLDLAHEPSGIASAVFEAAAFTVHDAAESKIVNPRL